MDALAKENVDSNVDKQQDNSLQRITIVINSVSLVILTINPHNTCNCSISVFHF